MKYDLSEQHLQVSEDIQKGSDEEIVYKVVESFFVDKSSYIQLYTIINSTIKGNLRKLINIFT